MDGDEEGVPGFEMLGSSLSAPFLLLVLVLFFICFFLFLFLFVLLRWLSVLSKFITQKDTKYSAFQVLDVIPDYRHGYLCESVVK